MPRPETPLQKLHIRLMKSTLGRIEDALEEPSTLRAYRIRTGMPFEGRLYVAPPAQGSPPWMEFVETGIQGSLERLTNRSNAAILIIRASGRWFAITFGYGRHHLREDCLVPDFGLRTALNSLDHSSLRSLDSLTIEEQTLHTRAQASRASGLQAFGLDVGKDILRAVTGLPRAEVDLNSVSGSEATLAVTARTDFRGLARLCSLLLRLYKMTAYRDHFAWVDNVARVSDPVLVSRLDEDLIAHLSSEGQARPYLAPPEPIEWEEIDGFNYTHQRRSIEPDMNLETYLGGRKHLSPDLDTISSEKVYVYGADHTIPMKHWSVYKCLVFETRADGHTYILTAGTWFEIDPLYARRIRRAIASMPVSHLRLPAARIGKDGRKEPEADYNRRAARSDPTLALMDSRLAACESAGSPIEYCDLFSTSRQMVHVKHRKGGSSSLSHLFAQARTSAEAFLADEQFRSEVRTHLANVGRRWAQLVPADKPDPALYQIVLAIIDAAQANPGEHLPFFSQLNLVRTYEELTSFGYVVSLLGIQMAGGSG